MTDVSFLQIILMSSLASAIPVEQADPFSLTVIHINDIHAHFEEVNVNTTRCRTEDNQDCFGGVARLSQKKKDIMKNDPDALFLNAGDFYQGTVWYSKFKYSPMIEFGNLLNYTAMGLGNHDFDDSILGIAPFAEQTQFDLLASNIRNNLNDSSFKEGVHYNKSTIKTVKGTKVGIIGYITRSTDYNFPHGSLEFLDELKTVADEAKRLKAEGVNILIALGHSGYEMDIRLAETVPELDLVVGGHSHTFLYTDKDGSGLPSNDIPDGDYPTYVKNQVSDKDKVIPVVQAYCYTKYLGHLELKFDDQGELLTPVDGNGVSFADPILLDKTVGKDPVIVKAMEKWQKNLTEYREVVGQNKVYLEERGPSEESNIGNFLTDAYASVFNDTRISFTNNGGIRADLAVGNITYEDVLTVQPFDNTVDLVTMTGQGIKSSLENAAAAIDADNIKYGYPGFGYQVAGLKMKIIVTKDNVGSRITDLQVLNADGTYSDIDLKQTYNVALPSFLAGGGSRNQKQMRGIFDDNIISHVPGDKYIYEAVRDYFKKNSPIEQYLEGRFVVEAGNSGARLLLNPILIILAIILKLLLAS